MVLRERAVRVGRGSHGHEPELHFDHRRYGGHGSAERRGARRHDDSGSDHDGGADYHRSNDDIGCDHDDNDDHGADDYSGYNDHDNHGWSDYDGRCDYDRSRDDHDHDGSSHDHDHDGGPDDHIGTDHDVGCDYDRSNDDVGRDHYDSDDHGCADHNSWYNDYDNHDGRRRAYAGGLV